MAARARLLAVVVVLAGVLSPGIVSRAAEPPGGAAPVAERVVSPATGTVEMLRAIPGAVLAPVAAGDPEARARAFLFDHGDLLGVDAEDVAGLRLAGVDADAVTGHTAVRFDQTYEGLVVFGAQMVVNLTDAGVTAVSGAFVPVDGLATAPAVSPADASARAVAAVAADHPGEVLAAADPVLHVYRHGLIERRPGPDALVHVVDVSGDRTAMQVLVDAASGDVVRTLPLRHDAKDRCVYTPAYVNPTGGDELAVRREGEPATGAAPLDNLYDFSGQVYDFFATVFGRDSFDGAGATMRTVYDATALCPNAYWDDTEQVTRYCPGFDIDDVVAHEWGHAYTGATHGLIYANQPGALNESYSDIFGEVVDLTNGVDGDGGSNNAEPFPAGQRWLVGEDLGEDVAAALGLRDMWDPERRGLPAKVSSASYYCGTGDGGGVHYNSSVPNHAFAMVVDGKTFNGHTVDGLGLTKAVHVYFRAMVAYQTPTTGFAEHAQALRASCADLVGATLPPVPGDPAGQVLTALDCDQVEEAIAAVELELPPPDCGAPLLDPDTPGLCPGATLVWSEDFEGGLGGWTLANEGTSARWIGTDWVAATDLPGGRAGTAAFAENSLLSSDGEIDPTGRFSITSPVVTATADNLELRFTHSVATDFPYDGGNLALSVNGAAFGVVTPDAFTFNPPNRALGSGPKQGEPAWTGTDQGVLTGAWGTSIVDLRALGVGSGDTIRLRFEFGQDSADGVHGWYVDDVELYGCVPTPAPVLSLGAGYTEPDGDGAFDLAWLRDPSATGPDLVQESVVSAPLLVADATSGLDGWVAETEGTGALAWTVSPGKPGHPSAAYWAPGNEAATDVSATLTSASPVAVPAAGETRLTFREWAYNHGGDRAAVEVSPDGSTWTSVFSYSTPNTLAGEVGYLLDPMRERTVDLTAFAGQSLYVRFRFSHGGELYVDVTRFGWYVDDIAVSNVVWSDLASVGGTAHPVTGRAAGQYRYRVRTAYGPYPSPWSNVVVATVG